jgi:integrase
MNADLPQSEGHANIDAEGQVVAARAWLSPEGLWYCREYRDTERHLRSFGRGEKARKLAEATAERINAERVLERQGVIRTSTSLRLKTYAEEWMKTAIEPHKASGTVRNYRQLLDDHVLPELGQLTLGDIKAHVVRAFIADKLKAEHPRARNTVRNMVAVLRTILNHAVEVDELLQTNPAAKFGKRFFEGASRDQGIHVEVFEEAEVASILKAARRLFPDYELLVRTLFFTGLRLGELLGLRWEDWDFRRGLLVVRRKVKVHKGELLIEETKTHRQRKVDVADELLARWRELREQREPAAGDWCCPSVKSPARPLNASWFNHAVWGEILKAAKLRRLRVHDTRHTYAAVMLGQGKSIEYVSQQLGHTKIDVTIRFYAHFKPGAMRHLANDFEARIRAHEAIEE